MLITTRLNWTPNIGYFCLFCRKHANRSSSLVVMSVKLLGIATDGCNAITIDAFLDSQVLFIFVPGLVVRPAYPGCFGRRRTTVPLQRV